MSTPVPVEPTDGLVDAGGLTQARVAELTHDGYTNAYKERSSRSAAQILRANIFTIFNAILAGAVVIVLAVGHWQDAVFGFVLLINTATGTIAEIRAKRALDKLSVLAAPTATVIRGGEVATIEAEKLVLGDLMKISAGQQIPADGVVHESSGVEIDESILTGESDTVRKRRGEMVMSGTTVTAGSALMEVTAVGAHAYARRLAAQAKKYSVVRSELQEGTNKVLRWISWVIVPMTILLVWSQLRVAGGVVTSWDDGAWKPAVVLAVAGVVGMVPQGLVLLTSVNFAAASISLARKNVLVQELPAVEVLARVDSLCLDKTGTLTTGAIGLHDVKPCGDYTQDTVNAALLALARVGEANATATAIDSGLGESITALDVVDFVPFSSARKWSAIRTNAPQSHGTWVLGAPEIVLAQAEGGEHTLAIVNEIACGGVRVVALAHSPATINASDAEPSLPSPLTPAALVTLGEKVRPDAAQTLAYFKDQGVQVRIISGDNPTTVAAIAASVGVSAPDGGPVEGIDARTLPHLADNPRGLAQALEDGRVFGRVTPEQKRDFVSALQSRGHVVAMTGDGVNDALALKDADLGIAMGNAAPATKAVARLVLLDGQFSSLPSVVAQGRRVMANMERVASLFLAKTTYAALIALVVAMLGIGYPFLPRQLTIVGSLTIGIPAFIMALAPTSQRYRSGFLERVLRLAVPCGLVVGIGVLVTRTWLVWTHTPDLQVATGSTLVLVAGGLWLLSMTARPWELWRIALVTVMAASAVLAVFIEPVRHFFALEWPDAHTWMVIAIMGTIVCAAVEAAGRFGAVVELPSRKSRR
ncbi:HAD-IC family P-type ATPase [Actinomyces vulturis]|uniref:HAD-IC family P-type ATPase n=1 Tax=Actinomyces vulturis TaxID=1857645 RepID=UPI000AACF036|nr:HAD-IC family P-type ATPase [Actinomyces vulturis]